MTREKTPKPTPGHRTRRIKQAIADLQHWCENVSMDRRDEKLGRLHCRLMRNRKQGTKRG